MFKPLLANPVNLKKLSYPCMASPKYDGFRCVITQIGDPVSRNLKPIQNGYVQAKLREMNMPPFDGELITYTGDKVDGFDVVQSKLTTRAGRPDFKYFIFDSWANPNDRFYDRYTEVSNWFIDNKFKEKYLTRVIQKPIENEEELLDFEAECLAQGWEGVMIRSLGGPYKFGRSTTNEGILLKMKRFFDAEATIISRYELMHNANEQTTDNLGHSVRSSHKANMEGMNKLGGFTVHWNNGIEFDVGTGFNDFQRHEYWRDDFKHIGQKIKFKYQSIGPSGKPRFPVFLGMRPDADLDGGIPF